MSESDFSGRLPGPVTGRAATAVVEQRVDGLLEHPLLVVDDDLRRAEVQQSLEAVVAVDDAAVQVVEVGGREAATVELHHRAQVRRDDRDGVEHHALRLVAGLAEGVDDLEALEGADLRWPLPLAMVSRSDSTSASRSKDSRRFWIAVAPMPPSKYLVEPVLHLAVEHLVALRSWTLRLLKVPDLVETVDLALRAVADLLHLALRAVAHLAALVGLGALGLERGEVLLGFLARSSTAWSRVLEGLALELDLALERGQVGCRQRPRRPSVIM